MIEIPFIAYYIRNHYKNKVFKKITKKLGTKAIFWTSNCRLRNKCYMCSFIKRIFFSIS